MEDKKLKVHGVPEPKGTSWLKEVRIDAARNTVEALRRQAEKREFEEAKARGLTPTEVIEKGRQDIKEVDPTFGEVNEGGFEYDANEETKEVEDLKRQLEEERKARKEAEAKAQPDVKKNDKESK